MDLLTIAIAIACIGLLLFLVRSFVQVAFWLILLGILLVILYYLYGWLVQTGLWDVFYQWLQALIDFIWSLFSPFFSTK